MSESEKKSEIVPAQTAAPIARSQRKYVVSSLDGSFLSPPEAARYLRLPDAAFKSSVRFVAAPGTGKSRLFGRFIAFPNLVRGKPQFVLDPTGGIVSNLLDKLIRMPASAQRALARRIRYVDVGASDYIVPMPLYQPGHSAETLYETANRFPMVLYSLDPHLQSAPIMGWNSLHECAIKAGQIATAMGFQVDFVADLIAEPRKYKTLLREVTARYPELAPAAAYFRELMDPNSNSVRERRTGSFTNKLMPIVSDPTMLATFASSPAGIDWDEVVAKGLTVIVDFQNERDQERRRFKMIWFFRSFMDFAKRRGMAGRGKEIYFFIDELTQLLGNGSSDSNSVLADDLEEMVAVVARNYGVNPILAHQNLTQIDERIRNILMQCGTQIVGTITNPDDSLYLARQFLHYDPRKVKKREPVWMSVEQFDKYGLPLHLPWPEIIDYRTAEYTPEEQLLMASEQFRLPRFQFLVRPALGEGQISPHIHRISIERMDVGQYPDDHTIAQVLTVLRARDGIPMQALLDEIRARQQAGYVTTQKRVKSAEEPAILVEKFPHPHESADDLPQPSDTDQPLPLQTEGDSQAPGGDDDDFWR